MASPYAQHPDLRRRRNRKRTAAELEPPVEPQGPELGDDYVIECTPHGTVTREYHELTRRWWDKLRRSPFASAYQPMHWSWLELLAPLYDRWVTMADLDALKELRLQAAAFGLRPTDANRLDWTVDASTVGPSSSDRAEADEPPRAGKGSSTAAWYAYATQTLRLAIDEDATRAEIIAAVDEAKHGRPSRQDPRMRVYDGGAEESAS